VRGVVCNEASERRSVLSFRREGRRCSNTYDKSKDNGHKNEHREDSVVEDARRETDVEDDELDETFAGLKRKGWRR
jgi:hypothetical protein